MTEIDRNLTDDDLEAIEGLVASHAGFMVKFGHAALLLPEGHPHRVEMFQQMQEAEQALYAIAKRFFPEKHEEALRMKQQILNRMRPGAN